MKLEQLQPHTAIKGVIPDSLVSVVSVHWFGSDVLELTYKTNTGKIGNELIYRQDESRLELVEQGRPWSFDGDGALFRLASEAQRIRLAHLFDPVLAVHTSVVDPLPHQITAVYEAMLPRQPLRFLLADDPGAGKTIMAGLLIKELIARGDLQRCLIVCPGSLAEQWQDELYRRFQLPFEILTNDKLEAARTGNWFLETNLAIARLDKLSRNESVQQKLQAPDCRWDLVVCDEAHKMSATVFGGEIKYTKRYRLGQLLSTLTRHFLLMTATPHNGKEEDFQLFMALLDGDRFEGRFRDGVHAADVSDMMRRMVKESLLKFDGRPLFPARIAYTVPYKLSPAEAHLYKAVTDYVREEFNRAEALENDKRAGTVGFALTILQRRLASSPEAIHQSLRRRRERLESRLRELELLHRGGQSILSATHQFRVIDTEDLEDLEDAPDDEVQATEEEILDQATAARSIAELKAEIQTLKGLESRALGVRRSGTDTKWLELASLLGEIFTTAGMANRVGEPHVPYGAGVLPKPASSPHQKLVIFTEHRDTLNYLESRIATLLGRKEAVVVIHGGIGREERLRVQESFRHDPVVQVLLATDAAGEGINLQRAHLMVNYDLPWNPNRLEQRFGRIHRIGQTEVCHLWNLIADETREGDVYRKLLEKLEQAREALGGQVFDVLGKLQFEGKSLRDLLIEAIRHGEQPEVMAYLNTVLDHALDRSHIQNLLEERALAHDAMDTSRVHRIREEMERADARRLQPHYIESFFHEAFQRLGGSVKQREARRYEITHVPAPVRNRDRLIGIGEPVLPRYQRIAFEKSLVAPHGELPAAFVCPGHPLLDSVIDLTLERHRDLLKRGAVLVDERDTGLQPRVLFYLEHSIQDASLTRNGERRVVSKRMLYVELNADDTTRHRARELFDRHKLPAFHDPFAGGGALPLEAQRLGLESYASDLNPVAVLINKAMIEIPPKFAGKPPVNPDAQQQKVQMDKSWKGAQGLAEDVRYYGKWMRDEAEKRIGHLYPKIEVTAEMAEERPDLKKYVGQKLTVIAWLWARTVKSPNPAFADVDVPLASTFMLSTKAGKEVYVEPVIESYGYRFMVKIGKPKDTEAVKNGTKLSRGANFQCLMSGTPIASSHIYGEANAGRMGSRLMTIVAEGKRGRIYLTPTVENEAVAQKAQPTWKPDLAMPENPRWFSPPLYGLKTYGDLFTRRQLVALTTFADLVQETYEHVKHDAGAAGMPDDGTLNSGGTGTSAYADSVVVYLSLAVDRMANTLCTIARWTSERQQTVTAFARQAIPMTWDFPEVNPFAGAAGDYAVSVGGVIKGMSNTTEPHGFAKQIDAATQNLSQDKLVSTDPPYYDNIGYADLSDFFYVWLRRSLKSVFPDLFGTLAVPKAQELVATPYRHGSKEKAETFFLEGMTQAMQRLADQAHPGFPVSIYYAFKQAENDGDDGTTNTGWDTFLDAVIRAGFAISGTWPMRTEMGNRMIGSGTNALASSIVLVCRTRPADASIATRHEFVTALKAELPPALAHLQHGNIARRSGAGSHRSRHGCVYPLRQGA